MTGTKQKIDKAMVDAIRKSVELKNFTFPHEASLLGQIMIGFMENLSAADF